MRRTLSLFLLSTVLLSSSGFTLNKHFCGEELAHITLGDEVKSCCGDEEEEMPSDCCYDEFDRLILDDSQRDHQSLQLQPLTFLALSVAAHFLQLPSETQVVSSFWTAFHSPPITGIDVYLRIQSFLI